MAATKLRTRIFAGLGALLFLVTASAFSIMVIWDGLKNDNDSATINSQTTENDTDSQTQPTENMLKGTQLADYSPVTSVSELQIIDSKVGSGEAVKTENTVTVDYTGAVASTGKIFESSLDSGQSASFGLNQVIEGWTEGLIGMKVGGTRRLVIPASKAYGANPPSADIPANADLVFDITLHSIK